MAALADKAKVFNESKVGKMNGFNCNWIGIRLISVVIADGKLKSDKKWCWYSDQLEPFPLMVGGEVRD